MHVSQPYPARSPVCLLRTVMPSPWQPQVFLPAEPTLENTYNGTYSVWGYEHIYTSKEPKAAVKAFIEYITGADYGKRIEELGYGVSSKMQTKEVH